MSYNYDPEELSIALNLYKYKNEELFKYDFAKIDRIIEIYFQQPNRDPIKEKQVIAFLFDCLMFYKGQASILFRHMINSPERNNAVLKLHTDKTLRELFQFDIINKSLFECSHDLINENHEMKNKIYNLFHIIYFSLITIPLLLIITILLVCKNNTKNKEIKRYINTNQQILEQYQKTKDKLENEIINNAKLEDKLAAAKKKLDEEIPRQISFIKEELTNKIEEQQKKIKDVIIEHMNNELPSIQENIFKKVINETNSEISNIKNQTNNDIDQIKMKINNEITNIQNQTKIDIDQVKKQVNDEIINIKNQTKKDIEKSNQKLINDIEEKQKIQIQKQINELEKKLMISHSKDQSYDFSNDQKRNVPLLVFKIILCLFDFIFELIIALEYKKNEITNDDGGIALLFFISSFQSIFIWFGGNVLFIINSCIFTAIIRVLIFSLSTIRKTKYFCYVYYIDIIACVKYYLAIPKQFSTFYYIFITIDLILFIAFYCSFFNADNNFNNLIVYFFVDLYLIIVDTNIGFMVYTICFCLKQSASIISFLIHNKANSFTIIFFVASFAAQFYYFFMNQYNYVFSKILIELFIFEAFFIALNIDLNNYQDYQLFIIIFSIFSRCSEIAYSNNFVIALSIIFGLISILISLVDAKGFLEISAKIFLVLSYILYFRFYIEWIIL